MIYSQDDLENAVKDVIDVLLHDLLVNIGINSIREVRDYMQRRQLKVKELIQEAAVRRMSHE